MNDIPDWWQQPRNISVLVDNPSWILPYAEQLVAELTRQGDHAVLCRSGEDVRKGSVAFLLGCLHITPPEILGRNQRNLVVHASDLPRGRGFSPWTWMIIEGENTIPVCLIEASVPVDSGTVIYRDEMLLQGHELLDEVRDQLGKKTIAMCTRFMNEASPPSGRPQEGQPTTYRRRSPADSRLDPDLSLAGQFDLLRTVDNSKYPAFFEHRGHRYKVSIEKMPKRGNDQ